MPRLDVIEATCRPTSLFLNTAKLRRYRLATVSDYTQDMIIVVSLSHDRPPLSLKLFYKLTKFSLSCMLTIASE